MKALKFDLEIPYWCSFGDFSSLNLKLSYPFPPLTTLFGLIQNSLGKFALHEINDKKVKNNLIDEYIEDFSHLKFSIIIKRRGELIEDYLNIHKGNRYKEKLEAELGKELKKNPNFEEFKGEFKNLKKLDFYNFLLNNNISDKKFEKTINVVNINSEVIEFVKKFWDNELKGIINYEANKTWLSTQINRQKLINPLYTIFILSNDKNGDFSLENIKFHLKNPKRPLYIGESDDVVNILNMSIVNINKNKSSSICSVLPGLYSNSELIKIPVNNKYDNKPCLSLCSIPNGDLDELVDCYCYNGENFVFI